MGARPKKLFSTEKIVAEYRNSIDKDGKIAELSAIINLRPRLKIFIDTLPTDTQLHELKSAGEYQGAIIVFDPMDGNCTEPQEVIAQRPLMDFCNGNIPRFSSMKKSAERHSCDGLLIIFKRLNDEEKERIYGAQ